MSNSYHSIRTPCIGVCSTGIGDSVCRGCKRFEHEVIHWNSYTPLQKASIDARLEKLLADAVNRRLQITSAERLQQQLKLQQIRYADWRIELCWLYELLKAGATQISSPADYGFRVNRHYEMFSLGELREQIDEEFYALSIAHFERYIVANQRKAVTVSR